MPNHIDEKGRAAIAQSAIAKRMRKKTGESTPTTKKWRVAMRGIIRLESEKLRKKHNTPEAWQRRRLASRPGAQFNEKGALSNYEEMKRRYPND